MVEQRGAHVEDEAFADPRRVVALDQSEQGVDDREEHRAQRDQRDEVAVLVGHGGVDHRLQEERRQRADDRSQHHRDHEADELLLVRPGQPEDAPEQGALDPLAFDGFAIATEASHHGGMRHHFVCQLTGATWVRTPRMARR